MGRLSEDQVSEDEKMSFDSEEYWRNKGVTYREEFDKKTFVQKIRYFIQEVYIELALTSIRAQIEVQKIVDVGCGFGRITRSLCELFPFAKIYAIDLSEDQLAEAKREMPRVLFRQNSILDADFSIARNQLTTAIELLMHIEPERIETAIESLVMGAEKFIVTVDWWTMDQVDIWAAKEVGFCWLHNYGKLFSNAGFYRVSEKKIPFVKQKIRVWRRRE